MKYWALLFLLAGCANFSALQTARTLPKNTGRVNLGLGFFRSPDIDAQVGEQTGVPVEFTLPYFEIGGRFGLMEDLDIGGKYTFPGFFSIDGKYQLFSSGGFVFSGGVGMNYLSIAGSASMKDAYHSTFFDLYLPSYISYDFNDWFALYTSPKYVMRYARSITTGGSLAHLAGTSVGIKVGNKGGFYLEGTYLKSLSANMFNQWQANIAFFYGNAPSFLPDPEPVPAPALPTETL